MQRPPPSRIPCGRAPRRPAAAAWLLAALVAAPAAAAPRPGRAPGNPSVGRPAGRGASLAALAPAAAPPPLVDRAQPYDADPDGAAEAADGAAQGPTAGVDGAAAALRLQAPAPAAPRLALHGAGFLSMQAPLGGRPSVNLLMVQGEALWREDQFSVFVMPRLRLQPVGGSSAEASLLFQQLYAAWAHPYGSVKLGKVAGRFGRPWDYGVYGPLLANYDLKQQPDLGLSAEGHPALTPRLRLDYAAQYFAVDGRALSWRNAGLGSAATVRRAHIVTARLAPTWVLGRGSVALGASAQRFVARRAGAPHAVWRQAVDVDVTVGPWQAFAEVGQQRGRDVAAPLGDAPVGSYRYLWSGTQLTLAPAKLRYHVNLLGAADGGRELLHQPGVEVGLTDHLALMAEVALWQVRRADSRHWQERSVYVVGSGSF